MRQSLWSPSRLPAGRATPAAAAAVVFALLLALVSFGIADGVDGGLLLALSGHGRPWLTRLMLAVTALGTWPAFAALALALALAAGPGERRRFIAVLLLTAASGLLNLALKEAIQRPRPDFVDVLTVAGGWSFPSGHAMTSLVFYAGLLHALVRRHPSRRFALFMVPMTAAVIAAVGLSRVYLGVHYPSDVLAGYAAGAAWLGFARLALTRARHLQLP